MSNLALVVNNNSQSSSGGSKKKTISSVFEEFLNEQLSENTAIAYRSDLKMFFKIIFDKEPKDVTYDDLLSLTTSDGLKFKQSINGKNSTIKRKIKSVKSFLKFVQSDIPNININIFNKIKIGSVDDDRTPYGNIGWDEAFLFIEYAFIEKMEGSQMAMLLKLACITSLRLESLLSLTWEDHFRVKNENGVVVNYIDINDKTGRHKVPVSRKFYNELRENLGTEGKLFPNLYPHKVGKFVEEITKYFEIDPRRNIKFHSFKKCGVNRVLQKTGDLTKAQLQGMHKSIVTTNNNYIELKDDLTLRPSYTLDEEIDIISEISNLSHDELLQAISNLSESSKFELLRIIKR